MSTLKNSKDIDQTQVDRFKEAARQLGCDENEATFDEKLKSITKRSKMKRNETDGRPTEVDS